MTNSNTELCKYLESLGAFDQQLEWFGRFRSLPEGWAACQRHDWMVWLIVVTGGAESPELEEALRRAASRACRQYAVYACEMAAYTCEIAEYTEWASLLRAIELSASRPSMLEVITPIWERACAPVSHANVGETWVVLASQIVDCARRSCVAIHEEYPHHELVWHMLCDAAGAASRTVWSSYMSSASHPMGSPYSYGKERALQLSDCHELLACPALSGETSRFEREPQ